MVATAAARRRPEPGEVAGAEFAPRIRVNSVLLGLIGSRPVGTRSRRVATRRRAEQWYAEIACARQISLGLGKPEEVARAIAFLCFSGRGFRQPARSSSFGGTSRHI
jgi:NAD(P)-dependent dehydrogenase (short-subunit alcohol dehydrogenase family)